MTIFQRIKLAWNAKSVVGITELARIFSGGSWGQTKYLEAYSKSLYVYSCVSKIAQKVASTRFKLYQITNGKGDTKEILNHPALDLIYRVNPFQTKEEFFETFIINKKLCGNAFILKVRDSKGKIAELWNLRPDQMTVITDPVNFIKGYKFTKTDGTTELFKPEDIIHDKYPSPLDAYLGISPLKAAAMRVDVEEFASRYQRDFFLNNARPDSVLQVEGNLFDDQKKDIEESWNEKFKGVGKNSKMVTLEGGMKYQQVSLSQKEMDYIESMKFTRDDILVAFGVPKSVVGITEDVNLANAQTGMYIFLSETIKPELERLVNKLNEELIYDEFGDNFYLDFTDPTPENRDQTLKEYESGLKNNYMLINEVRSREGLPPIVGGNTMYIPFGVSAIGGIPKEPPAPADDTAKVFVGKPFLKMKLELSDSITEIFTKTKKVKAKKVKTGRRKERTVRSFLPDAEVKQKYYELINQRIDKRVETFKEAVLQETKAQLGRVLKKLESLNKQLEPAGRKKWKLSDLFNFAKENKLMAALSLPFITENLQRSGDEALALVAPAETFLITEAIKEALEQRAEDFALSINNTTLTKLTATLGEGLDAGEGTTDLADRVQGVFKEFPDYRADTIARTEATAANNAGTLEGFRQSGVANGKEWIATRDERTRDSHASQNGDIVLLDEKFANGLGAPGEFGGDASETVNCRCVLAPAFVEK